MSLPVLAIENGGPIPDKKDDMQAYLRDMITHSKKESQRCLIKAEYSMSMMNAYLSRAEDLQRCLDKLEDESKQTKPVKGEKKKKEKKKWKPTGYTVFMKERVHDISSSMGKDENSFNLAAKEWNGMGDEEKEVWKKKAAEMPEQESKMTINVSQQESKTTTNEIPIHQIGGAKRPIERDNNVSNSLNVKGDEVNQSEVSNKKAKSGEDPPLAAKKEKKKRGGKPNGYQVFIKQRFKEISANLGKDENAFTLLAKEWTEMNEEAKSVWKKKASELPDRDIV